MHLGTLLVVGLLLLATAAAALFSERVVRTDRQRLLKERTGEVAVVLSTAISQLSVGLQSLGQVASVTNEAPGPFETTARAVSASTTADSYALLRPAGGGFEVVVASGPAFRTGQLLTGAQVPAIELALHSHQTASTPVLGVGAARSFGIALGPPAAPVGTVVYRESILGPLGPPKEASTAPFHELNVVLYAGSKASASEALVSTAHSLPLRGEVQAQTLNIGATRLLLTVSSAGHLVGSLTADATWLVVAFGLLISALIGFVVEQAGRGRDSALALYRAQRAVAETLQRSLLPDLGQIPGLSIATRYLPGAVEQQIGGDWFDCFQVGHGGEDRLAVVIGDVMGHDMQAAAAMAQVRAALRAYSCETDDPASVLERLQRLVEILDIAPLVTVFYGVLDPIDGRGKRVLRYSNAGHLPPLLREPDGAVTGVGGATSTIIGAPHVGGRPVEQITMGPGASLVLFTDGLVETVGGDVSEAIDDLAASVSALDASATAEELGALLERRSARPLRDDVAILVVQIAATRGPDQGRPAATHSQAGTRDDAGLALECGPGAPGVARSWIAAELAGWPPDVVDAASLIISELVANAVLHAHTAITVAAEHADSEVHVRVIDDNPELPVVKRYGATAETGRGFKLVSAMADDWGVEPIASGGKAVWFSLLRHRSQPRGASPVESFETGALADLADLSAWPDLDESGAGVVPEVTEETTLDVLVLGLPTDVYLLTAEHNDALLRELALLGTADLDSGRGAHPRDVLLGDTVTGQLTPMTGSLRHQIEAAIVEGRRTVDLHVRVPIRRWKSLIDLADRLDEADRLCGDGAFLTLEAPAEVQMFRHWFAQQVIDQARGRSATPWPYAV